MNRRDIIIVAVLINAGLLVTLFVSSLKKESQREFVSSSEPTKAQAAMTAKHGIPQEKPGDQVERVISRYTEMVKAEEKKEEILPSSILPSVKKEEENPLFQVPIKAPLRIIMVEKGDVLEKIARNYGVSVDEIMRLNDLPNSRLKIGQELKLPEKRISQKESKRVKEEEGKYYVVKGGDSPWTIAQKHHIQVEELLKLNHIDEEKAKRLRPGDRLRIK